jgi:hypothetical protein
MTGFFGAAIASGAIAADDRRLCPRDFQREQEVESWHDLGYNNLFWPRSGLNSDAGIISNDPSWGQVELVSGAVGRFGYRGVTRDANNSPIGGVTVKIFRTADDTKVADDVVSDADGNFIISTPFYESHYLVMRKTGAPEISGVTVSSQFPNS